MLENFIPFSSAQILDIEGLRKLGMSRRAIALDLGICQKRTRKFVSHLESKKDLRCPELGIEKVTRMVFDFDPNNTFEVIYKPVSVARVSILA